MNRELTNLVLLGVGALVLYQVLKKKIGDVTAPVSDAIAKLWLALTEQPPMQVVGDVVLPDGSTVPLSTLPIRADAQNRVYTNLSGHVYQLQPHDANGNWPAVLVQ
jgi:hypothetical protein